MIYRLLKRPAMLAAAFFVLLITGQNCFQNHAFISQGSLKSLNAGNGDAYSGMVALYASSDLTQPCVDKDLVTGSSLPNDEILFKYDDNFNYGPYLVRQACADLPPTSISTSTLPIPPTPGTGSITYNDKTFQAYSPATDFDIFVASCPTGTNPISAAKRTNSFVSARNWLDQTTSAAPGWSVDQGVGVSLYGTLASLPSFKLERNDPNNLDSWRRAGQILYINASTNYSFTFLARADSVSAVDWHFVRQFSATSSTPQDESVDITFDIGTLTTTTQWSVNITNVSATIRAFENGYICTVYFTSSATDNAGPMIDIGIAPSTGTQKYGQLGDSVLATNPELVPVGEFCK